MLVSKTMEGWEEETVCIHCNSQCWVEGDDCKERMVNKTRVEDTMDGFFVRLLILDDIKENQKNRYSVKVPPVKSSDETSNLTPARYISIVNTAILNITLLFRRPIASDDPLCPKCGEAVYAAEACHTSGGSYHTQCLTCMTCHRVLNTLNAVTAPGGDIYCTTCYKYR